MGWAISGKMSEGQPSQKEGGGPAGRHLQALSILASTSQCQWRKQNLGSRAAISSDPPPFIKPKIQDCKVAAGPRMLIPSDLRPIPSNAGFNRMLMRVWVQRRPSVTGINVNVRREAERQNWRKIATFCSCCYRWWMFVYNIQFSQE